MSGKNYNGLYEILSPGALDCIFDQRVAKLRAWKETKCEYRVRLRYSATYESIQQQWKKKSCRRVLSIDVVVVRVVVVVVVVVLELAPDSQSSNVIFLSRV